MTTTPARPPVSPTADHRAGRVLGPALGLYAGAVFVLLWAGAVIGWVTGGATFADAWAWLSSLDTIAAVLAWILFLPIAVGLWAIDADLPPLAGAAIVAGLVVWTLAAASSLVRVLRRRRQTARPS
jgi:hypothetical protein